jgi:cyanophycin synthetase
VLEATVDVGAWKHLSHAEIEACERRLEAGLPTLATRKRAGAIPIEEESIGARLAGSLVNLALELRAISRPPSGVGRSESADSTDQFWVVLPCDEEALDRACLDSAIRLWTAAARGDRLFADEECAKLYDLGIDVCLDDHTAPVLAAAIARGIPWRRLDNARLVQLGWGSRQQRVQKAFTSHTGKIAEWMSLDKLLTKRLLQELGVPVALGRLVSSAEDAWTATCELASPVVVKPRDADYCHGVGINLVGRDEVMAAYRAAREFREDVLVERYAHGEHYRVTVVAGRVVAADQRIPPAVIGDGQHTILELIEIANLDPRRGSHRLLPLEPIDLDTDSVAVVAEQGFDVGTRIIPAGVHVVLSRVARLASGAGGQDVTDRVHPLVAEQCERAARAIGLDVAGIDLIAQDIGRPLEEQGGAILEVNAEPALFFHFPPFSDVHRPVCERIVESLFPLGETGRIPLVGVTGHGRQEVVCRWVAHWLASAQRRVGVASSGGRFLGDRVLRPGDESTLAGLRALLLDPDVDAAVVERSQASIRSEGLGFDRCDVAVLVIGPEPVQDASLQAMRVLVEAVAADGHIVTDAPAAMLEALHLVSDDRVVRIAPDRPRVSPGSSRLLRTARIEEHAVVLTGRHGEEHELPIDGEPAGARGEIGPGNGFLASLAAAWVMEVPLDALRARLQAVFQRWQHVSSQNF